MTITQEQIDLIIETAVDAAQRVGGDPSWARAVANGVVAGLATAGAFEPPHPAGAITRKRADEILNTEYPQTGLTGDTMGRVGAKRVIDALDRAGAFPGEATLAEIADVARGILRAEASWRDRVSWRDMALRLASACRAAGLVRGAP